MPKMKSSRSANKRFKVTGSGRVTARRPNRYHLNEKKASKRLRRLQGDNVIAKADEARVKKMLGI